MAIQFYFNEIFIKLPERKRLKQFLSNLFKTEGKQLLSLSYIFCTDKYLLSVNKEFLKHDDYTDIITFSLGEDDQSITGEIYISAERVKENAKNIGVSVTREIHRVIFHGALHLCGYNDKAPDDKLKMTRYEDKYLELYFG